MDVSPDAYLLETSAEPHDAARPAPAPSRAAATTRPARSSAASSTSSSPAPWSTSCRGRPNFSIGPIVPRGTDKTYRFLDYFVAEDADEAWIEESLAFDAQVGAEDRVLIERVQAGMQAG